jgi:hypothetical protein
MPTLPAPVDDNGNITVPAESGVTIPIREQSNDAIPVPIDISALPLRFLVKGRLDKMLEEDPNNALGQLLVITEEDADQLGTTWKNFVLLDMTVAENPISLWYGKIRRAS